MSDKWRVKSEEKMRSDTNSYQYPLASQKEMMLAKAVYRWRHPRLE
jgi:hypothetical protein